MTPSRNAPISVPRVHRELEGHGIGIVEVSDTAAPDARWLRLESLLTAAIHELVWNDFLVVGYDAAGAAPSSSDAPTAWLRTGPDGVHCAIGSAPSGWPCHDAQLRATGWRAPADEDQPWTCGPFEPREAARRTLTALREARACPDPYAFRWGSGSFPCPEGTTGTLTIIDPQLQPSD